YAEILQNHYTQALDESGRELLNFIVEGAHRTKTLVRDLLAYTKTTSEVDQPMELVNANEALCKALLNLFEVIRESKTDVVHEPLTQLRIHEVHLQQLFQNLIENAIKYRSATQPKVSVYADKVGADWRFAIQDNGIGIGRQHKETIFGVFKRLHGKSEYPGSGLGLAICKRLVERYGGQIWVESEP